MNTKDIQLKELGELCVLMSVFYGATFEILRVILLLWWDHYQSALYLISWTQVANSSLLMSMAIVPIFGLLAIGPNGKSALIKTRWQKSIGFVVILVLVATGAYWFGSCFATLPNGEVCIKDSTSSGNILCDESKTGNLIFQNDKWSVFSKISATNEKTLEIIPTSNVTRIELR